MKYWLLFTAFMFCPVFAGGLNAFEKPNIILVFVDDMGWQDFSCFGNKDAQTPNIDRLAKEGGICFLRD